MQLGIELALMGIGTVFTFLVLLIFVTSMMSKAVTAFEKRTSPPAVTMGKTLDTAVVTSPKLSDEMLATVITAAIKQHRAKG
jgi:oxaloacetate decarboxylase gamma subunit